MIPPAFRRELSPTELEAHERWKKAKFPTLGFRPLHDGRLELFWGPEVVNAFYINPPDELATHVEFIGWIMEQKPVSATFGTLQKHAELLTQFLVRFQAKEKTEP